MQKYKVSKIVSMMILIAMIVVMIGCDSNSGNSGNTNAPAETNQNSAPAETPEPSANTDPIIVVWYPNESSNTHEEIRAEVARLIEQATGRKAENKTTTDYTIAIESIASGSADIAMAMGAVGYIEAQGRNPQVGVLFVNSDKNWSLDEAKYFSWICVNAADADQYKSGDTYSIDNIKGKKMSFVSNSSTSGFRVPTSGIISHFASDNLDEDMLIEGGPFFNEVYFGGSHQGSAINLITGIADAAAYCDTELDNYVRLKEGVENTVGAVYEIREGADAPFDVHAGKDFLVIACTPVFNGPNAYNPQNLSEAEIQAIRDLFTSEEVASNEIIFYDDTVEGAIGLFKKSASYGYVLVDDSWYDPYR